MIEADCSECGYEVETEGISEAVKAFNKHYQHTDHNLEINHFEVELDLGLEAGYEVVCSQCDVSWRFSRRKNAKDHAQEHENYTDHEPDGVEATEVLTKETIESLVQKLHVGSFTDSGVPETILIEYCLSIGYNRSEAMDAIERAKDDGKIYPIRRGFYQSP